MISDFSMGNDLTLKASKNGRGNLGLKLCLGEIAETYPNFERDISIINMEKTISTIKERMKGLKYGQIHSLFERYTYGEYLIVATIITYSHAHSGPREKELSALMYNSISSDPCAYVLDVVNTIYDLRKMLT